MERQKKEEKRRFSGGWREKSCQRWKCALVRLIVSHTGCSRTRTRTHYTGDPPITPRIGDLHAFWGATTISLQRPEYRYRSKHHLCHTAVSMTSVHNSLVIHQQSMRWRWHSDLSVYITHCPENYNMGLVLYKQTTLMVQVNCQKNTKFCKV